MSRVTSTVCNDFIWSNEYAVHAVRRGQILKAHPQVSKLSGPEWRSKYICLLGLVIPQFWLSWATQDLNWMVYLTVAYVFGATLTQALFLAIHELSHNLFFVTSMYNRLFAMVVNLPIVVPYCVAFRGYHLEHHKHQGVDGVDTDVPTHFEGRVIRGPVTKALWVCCQIVTYALRPMCVRPQNIGTEHLINWFVQVTFNAVVCYTWGWRPLAFLLLCIVLAGGLHPCAGHFISEHYVFPHLDPSQETYSYYGPLNRLTWNVGYHNEHHDFPYIPWSRLPVLKKTAPEFYDTLIACESWTGVIWNYILRPEMGPYSRVKRKKIN